MGDNGLDSIEQSISRLPAAEILFASRSPEWRQAIKELFEDHRKQFPDTASLNEKAEQAFVLAAARVAVRHGSWGDDFHAYHNELHVREIVERRIDLLISQLGWQSLPAADWLALWLFAACHDLRQREQTDADGKPSLVGVNEAASVAESWRILDTVGFDRETDQRFYQTLRIVIAASTFDDRGGRAAKVAAAMGADAEQTELALLAADIDTANVAETLQMFVRTGIRLAKEQEYRAGRGDLDRNSAPTVLKFLTHGQRRYFFELQRFESGQGRKVFGPRKQRNRRHLELLCDGLEQHYADVGLSGVTGGAIIDELLNRAERLG